MKVICIIILSVMMICTVGCSNKQNNVNEPTGQHSLEIETTKDIVAGNEFEKQSSSTSQEATQKETHTAENVTTESQSSEQTQQQTEVVTQSATENKTQQLTQAQTERPTQQATQEQTQIPTQPQTQAQTEQSTQAPTQKPTEEATTGVIELPTYDIYSREYAAQVEAITFQYINQFRVEEGKFELKQMTNSLGIQFAYGRAEQLYTRFYHDLDMMRELSTKLKYGIYTCYETHGYEGEPYYEPYGTEAIAKSSVNDYVSPEALAYRIARSLRNSPNHWAYVGCALEVNARLTRIKCATYVKGDYAYTCVYMIEEEYN